MFETPRVLRRCVIAFAVIASLASATCAAATKVALPDGRYLSLEPPAGWRVEEQSNSLAVTLRFFSDRDSEHPTLQFTAFSLPSGREARSIEELKGVVEHQGAGLLSTATQAAVKVERLPLQTGAAFYYHLTDREQERGPGDFKELHQGFGEISRSAIAFTVLTHPGEDQVVKKALDCVGSITISGGPR